MNDNFSMLNSVEKLKGSFLSIIASLFTISTLFLLPLVFKTDHTDLYDTKYVFYYVSALAAISFALLSMGIVFLKERKVKRTRLQKWEIALLFFVCICILSTIQSDYIYEAFWGNEGRYNGLFLMLLYCVTTFMLGRFLNMRQWYLDIFLVGGLLVSFFGITDYFYLDLLNFKGQMDEHSFAIFMSTIGNINAYTSYLALVLGVSAGLFLVGKSSLRRYFYFGCYVIYFIAIVMGTSDNAYLAIGTILGLLPLYALIRKDTAKRYFVLLSASVTLIQLIAWINERWEDRVIGIDSLLSKMGGNLWLLMAVMILWGVTIFSYYRGVKKNDSDDELAPIWRYLWIVFLGGAFFIILFVLYDVNVAGNAARYGSMENYLYFDDEWGTYRGYAWRIAWENYLKLSPLHKLFGYGLDTFSILTIYNNKWEMAYEIGSRYDSVHNEYLQYLVTIGIVGVVAYFVFFAVVVWTILKNIKRTPYLLGIIIAVTAYWVQAAVNISQMPVAPIVWALIAVGMAACRTEPRDVREM